MILPILDLKDVTVQKQFCKVEEELNEYSYEHLGSDKSLEEWFDVLQAVLHLGIKEFGKEKLVNYAAKHYAKLQARDREIIGDIEIYIKQYID